MRDEEFLDTMPIHGAAVALVLGGIYVLKKINPIAGGAIMLGAVAIAATEDEWPRPIREVAVTVSKVALTGALGLGVALIARRLGR